MASPAPALTSAAAAGGWERSGVREAGKRLGHGPQPHPLPTQLGHPLWALRALPGSKPFRKQQRHTGQTELGLAPCPLPTRGPSRKPSGPNPAQAAWTSPEAQSGSRSRLGQAALCFPQPKAPPQHSAFSRVWAQRKEVTGSYQSQKRRSSSDPRWVCGALTGPHSDSAGSRQPRTVGADGAERGRGGERERERKGVKTARPPSPPAGRCP